MTSLRPIDIDFDVHKRIELARESYSETPNAVLRRLLGIDAAQPVQQAIGAAAMRAWSGKGVQLPHGTRVRMQYNGRTHGGEIVDGLWQVEGKQYSSPSGAAGGVARTKGGRRTSLDGWIYWWVLMPGEKTWVKLSEIREDEPGTFEPNEEREIEVRHSYISVANLPPMSLPSESEVMTALETLLRKIQRPITPSEAYRALADEFRLSKKQRSRLMDNGKDCHWENRVRFARRKLVDAGIMSREPRGYWSLVRP